VYNIKNKINCGRYPIIYPLMMTLIGAHVDGKANVAPIEDWS
jgi:hypothetical protein